MKCMNDGNTTSSSDDGNNHNLLGFSLSPHMKMDLTSSHPSNQNHDHYYHYHNQNQSSSSSSSLVPSNFYMSPLQLNNTSSTCYDVGQNSNFIHSSFPMMPLKSDGSLYLIDESLTRSHSQVIMTTLSPKLEDFLGGATMGTTHNEYEQHESETMSLLSLDSIYYSNNNAEQQDHSSYYSQLSCNGIYQSPLLEQEQEQPKESIFSFKSIVAPKDFCLEQQNQALSLSMSPNSQSSCISSVVPTHVTSCGSDSVVVVEPKKRGHGKVGQKQPMHRKSIDTFGQRTSQYRGVTRHRWTGRYEAHLWDNSCKKEGQTRKGRQVYLGGYDMEEKAARAYDLAALKYWGPSTHINFMLENYQNELEEMNNMNRQEYVAHLRRKSSGFSRGASMYRGVTRHHQHGRWQARIGRVAGNRDLYLGTFSTQEEAAEAYDVAAIKFRGLNAVTNFDMSKYNVEKIMSSNTLLAGEQAKSTKNKDSEPKIEAIKCNSEQVEGVKNNIENNWNESPQEQESNTCDKKSIKCRNFKENSTFSMSLQDIIGIDSVGGSSHDDDSSNKMIRTHFSNSSSLVTSLSSSRECSPDKGTDPTMLFPKPPIGSKKLSPIASSVGSWFSSMSHFPVFATWSDT